MNRRIFIMLVAFMIMLPCGYVAAEDVDKQVSIQENEHSDIPVIIDVLVLRPVGLATCVVGLAATVVALPFAIPSKSTDKVYNALIAEPFDYTFKRPLGKNRPMKW